MHRDRSVVGRRPRSSAAGPLNSQYNTLTKCVCSNPLDRLCDLLLDWEIKPDLVRTKKDDSVEETKEEEVEGLPTHFSCFQEYITKWEPLIVTEMRETCVSNFRSKPVKSIKRGILQFTVCDAMAAATVEVHCQVNPQLAGEKDGGVSPSMLDLVLLSADKIDFPLKEAAVPLAIPALVIGVAFSSGVRTLQIKLRSRHWLLLRDKAAVNSPTSTTNVSRPHAPSSRPTTYAALQTFRVHFTIVENMRSNWREFQAAHELGINIPLVKEILVVDREIVMLPTPPVSDSEDAPVAKHPPSARSGAAEDAQLAALRQAGFSATFVTHLQQNYNSSQFRAITTAAMSKGFTLIQGPPGTGKTSTIIALLNALHMREYNHYYEDLLQTFLGPVGLDCRRKGEDSHWLHVLAKHTKAKPRILIVAPSNVAVDNIILRIMEKGFLDGGGSRYNPSIVRVGSGKSAKVQAVGLEHLVEAELLRELPMDKKRERLEQIQSSMSKALREVEVLQAMLINMKKAFQQCCPLPEGWELRINADSGQPYWVDHTARCTSTQPPVQVSRPAGPYRHVKQLPEYRIFSHSFTQKLSALETMQVKRARLQAVLHAFSVKNREVLPAGTRDMLESSIIDEAQLLLTTINSCGHPSMESTEFCLTIVDEAAQCVEPSTLIALRRGCRQCVMVGDQNQLPATVFSDAVRKLGYDRSLFERLIASGHPYVMLDTQYRMCPELSEFPSRQFYGGNLRDGSNVEARSYLPSCVQVGPRALGDGGLDEGGGGGGGGPRHLVAPHTLLPLLFFDLRYSRDQQTSSLSKVNHDEVQFCMKLLGYLCGVLYRNGMGDASIGVITPYNEQHSELLKAYRKVSSKLRDQAIAALEASGQKFYPPVHQALNVEFNTVDGFQGKEKDVVLFSAVRANEQRSIGFLADTRRMNVAITRARYCLMIVGNANTLRSDPNWRALVGHATFRRCLFPLWRREDSVEQALMGRAHTRIAASASTSVSTCDGGAPTSDGSLTTSDASPANGPLEDGELEDGKLEGGRG